MKPTDYDRQMRMLRQAGRVGEAADLLTMVDCAGLLLDAGYALQAIAEVLAVPVQGNVTKLARLREAMDIARAWPDEFLLAARKYNAPWHSLREPARWWRTGQVERDEVLEFTEAYGKEHRTWPRIDDYRRQFGKAVTNPQHVPEGQGQLT